MKLPPGKSSVPLSLALVAFTLAAGSGILGRYALMWPSLVAMWAFLALFFQGLESLRTFTFTFWVLAFFFGGLTFPALFGEVWGFDQKVLIVPLIQVILFGMGATLSLADFGRAVKMPKAVLTGMLLQFTVMPVLGWAIATSFGFSPEIAAGIILIGSCSGGVASNVMAYLARGNVALSVTMTACSTVMAPLATPFLMKVLAGRLIEIDVLSMMLSIVNLILLPIGCGLAAHYFLHSNLPGKVWRPPVLLAAALFLMAAEFGLPGTTQLYSLSAACLLMACLQRAWVERGLPIVSMGGICYIIAIIAAGSRSDILASGVLLFGAALLHNVSGYAFGYWGGRLGSLPERDCRTVAFEVGMQNGGMGTALAINVLQSGAAALGPVVFGTWMNLSGSTLASYWKGRPPNRSRIGAPLEEKKASLPDS